MTQSSTSDRGFKGLLHVYVAFDWGEEIHLGQVQRLVAAEPHALPRKPRTPPSISYQSPPLRLALAETRLTLPELGELTAAGEVTVFDFGTVSLAFHVPFELNAARLTRLAGSLADPAPIIQAARDTLRPLFERISPAVDEPLWTDLSEEYFVFQVFPDESLARPDELCTDQAEWAAALVRLESEPLSRGEIAEATRLRLSYGPQDLVVADWAAALVVDRDCDEILEAIAFANVQLLEFRHIDSRLDARLAAAYTLIRDVAGSWLPFWRTHARPLRELGKMKAEVNEMLERASNALTLVGDPYLARVYQLLATRLHLDEWNQNLRRSIAVLEGIYQVVADQAATLRGEVLEAIIVALIVFEIVMALAGR